MNEIAELMAQVAAARTSGKGVETALKARSCVMTGMGFVRRADSAARTERMAEIEKASFSELAASEPVMAFAREYQLVDKLAFVGRLGLLAMQGRRVKRTQAELAAEFAEDFLACVRMKIEPGAPAHVFRERLTERETREQYIDLYLAEAGWEVADREHKGVMIPGGASVEYKVTGMPPHGQDGYCDYVLFGLDGSPLAVVEAKRTSRSPEEGRTQARFYADRLEAASGARPVVYTTNGYEIWCSDGYYPERRVYAFHARQELERMRGRQNGPLGDRPLPAPRTDIVNRPYQLLAITALCEHFAARRRKGLLVMATGTGKTRVAVALVEVLMRAGWVKNVLFLADRTELVRQAKKAFVGLLPDVPHCVLSERYESGSEQTARLVLSTYQTMIHYIDGEAKDFTTGRFDLVITDEAHRTIFNKYRAIFHYFDALLVGLTATPREDVDSNTYALFACEQGCPNFDYSLAEGVKDRFLVPYKLRNKTTAVLQGGITYAELTEAERAHYEERFSQAGYDETPDRVASEEIFRIVYNECTCDRMLETLMREGQRVESGELIGKSVIFAVNHRHADMIVRRFNAKFPELGDAYCQLIDNQVEKSGEKIDEFRDKRAFRIAVSVDMLDTGVDVPEIVNLVFFKKVRSKIKFNQMLGRGTRLCPDLFGPGEDKRYFTCFDYLGNFAFFGQEGAPADDAKATLSVSQRIFMHRVGLMLAMQHVDQQKIPTRRDHWLALRAKVSAQVASVRAHGERMMVKLAMPHLDKYRLETAWAELSEEKVKEIRTFIAPLVEGDEREDERVKLFDEKMLRIERATLAGGGLAAVRQEMMTVRKTAQALLEIGTVDAIRGAADELRRLASSEYWDGATVESAEGLRKATRELVRYLDPPRVRYVGLHVRDAEIDLANDVGGDVDIRTYRERVTDYLERNMTRPVIQRLRTLSPLLPGDVAELERILWHELGTRADYEAEGYAGSLAGFVRQLVGLDDDAVMEKFGAFLDGTRLNFRQQEFVSDIVDFIRQNGEIAPRDLAESDPFAEFDVNEVFLDRPKELDEIVTLVAGIVDSDRRW